MLTRRCVGLVVFSSALTASALFMHSPSADVVATEVAAATFQTGGATPRVDADIAAHCGGVVLSSPAAGAPRLEIAALGRMPAAADTAPPPGDAVGKPTHPITTRSEDAQRHFDRGVEFVHALDHAEAIDSFRRAQRLDPWCAMCYWGEALALGPTLDAPMAADDHAPAFRAVARARALSDDVSFRERALIAALANRYAPHAASERVHLDRAYAAAMADVVARFPDDPEIAVLYAEALMNLAHWDDRESGGAAPAGRAAEIVATLERVLDRQPEHPAAIRLYARTRAASGHLRQ